MTDRLLKAAALAALGLSATGCGSSDKTAGGTAASVGTGSPAATTSASTARQQVPSRTGTKSSPAPRLSTNPPPVPSGTPPAPPGLRQTSGYATYELCSAECSGAVPASLRRPLHIPHQPGPCHATGGGLVRPLQSNDVQLMPFVGSSWQGARVTWDASPSYGGPLLIRGRRVDGSGAIGFGEGHVPYDELQLLAPGQGASTPPGGGREWLTFTRAIGPGCYGYQIDGTTFSEVIVFRAGG